MAFVPDFNGSSAILPLWDGSFETGIVIGVVFGFDGEVAYIGGFGDAFGYGPAFEHAVFFEAEVIVECSGVVFLDDVDEGFFVFCSACGFGGCLEIAFRSIFREFRVWRVIQLFLGSKSPLELRFAV